MTFRLADSLPKTVEENLRFERKDIIQTASRLGRPLTRHEESRIRALYSEKVEKYLGQGLGKSWMHEDRIARIVAEALAFFNGDRYRLRAWCVMPNHVHAVLEPLSGHDLPEILLAWNSFRGKEINRVLCARGRIWETEYYDHLIRDERDLRAQIEYVLANPRKSGLENWKWVGAAR